MNRTNAADMASVAKKALALLLTFCLVLSSWVALPATAETAPEDQPPLAVDDFIGHATAKYIATVDGKEQQIAIGEDTIIPKETTALVITVQFENVPTAELRDQHRGTLTYQLPEQLKSPTVDTHTIYNEKESIGDIRAADGKVVLTYNNEGLPGDQEARTSGYFSFQCELDKEKIKDNPTTITIGQVPITLKFEEADIAETGTLNISKPAPRYVSGTDAAKEGYLDYTLTVTTGNDAMPDVRVEDSITAGAKYTKGYLVAGTLQDGTMSASIDGGDVLADGSLVTLPGNNGTVSIAGSNPGKMTWAIGEMPANASCTLTYRVKLGENYVGLYNRNPLKNTAVPYSKNFAHGSASSEFTPSAEAEVTKRAGDPTQDAANNTVTIPYTVEIQASDQNTWPIRNVKIADNLGDTYKNSGTATPDADRAAMCEYARFENFQVREFDPTNKTYKDMPIPSPVKSDTNPKIYYEAGNAYNPRFDMYVGDAAPGKSLVLNYDLVVKNELFTTRNGSWNLKNNVSVRTDDNYGEGDGGNANIGTGRSERSIGTQTWERKLQGDPLKEELKQSPGGERAEATIPAGAIPYQVAVNEDGKWDVTQAAFTDTLGSHLRYVGYVQMDYYADGVGESASASSDDKTVVDALKSKTPTSTYYYDVNGETSFSYTPESLGISGTGAYLLTYYVVPDDIGNVTAFYAENSFSLSGLVLAPGTGQGSSAASPVTIAAPNGLTVRRSRLMAGGTDFSTRKSPWYYDSGAEDAYWIISGIGTEVPQGLSLIDTPTQNLRAPELMGVYLGPQQSSDQFAKSYNSFREITESNGFAPLPTGDCSWQDGTLTFNEKVTIPKGRSLYVIVKTHRQLQGKVQNTASYLVKNKLSLREADKSEARDIDEATMTTNGGGDLYKELGQIISRNADDTWRVLAPGTDNRAQASIATDAIAESGIYIDWRIRMNYLGYLKGSYQVTDSLPEGVEPVYVRYFQVGSALSDSEPTMPAVAGLGTDWKNIGLKDTAVAGSSSQQSANAYYNPTSRQIRFDVGNLQQADGAALGSKSLEVQVVAKVTDDHAQAGEPVSFQNNVEMDDQAGNVVGRGTSDARVDADTVTKTTLGVKGGTLPFTITVNPRAENLANGSSTLTIVDEMLDPLEFDVASLRVTADGADITGSTVIRDGGRNQDNNGKVLYIDIPNSKKVVIDYNATPMVRQNTPFKVNNTAYLRGYDKGAAKSVLDNAMVAVSAGSSTTTPGVIVATKRDRDNVSTTLSHAAFQLQKMKWNAETSAWEKTDDAPLTAISGDDGKARFGNLEYNTPYCLTETTPPAGYEIDAEPRYLVIAKSTGSWDNPAYPEEVQTYADNGAQVKYVGSQMALDVYDSKSTNPGGSGGVNPQNPETGGNAGSQGGPGTEEPEEPDQNDNPGDHNPGGEPEEPSPDNPGDTGIDEPEKPTPGNPRDSGAGGSENNNPTTPGKAEPGDSGGTETGGGKPSPDEPGDTGAGGSEDDGTGESKDAGTDDSDKDAHGKPGDSGSIGPKAGESDAPGEKGAGTPAKTAASTSDATVEGDPGKADGDGSESTNPVPSSETGGSVSKEDDKADDGEGQSSGDHSLPDTGDAPALPAAALIVAVAAALAARKKLKA